MVVVIGCDDKAADDTNDDAREKNLRRASH